MRRFLSRYDISYIVHLLGGLSILFSVFAFLAYLNIITLIILSTSIVGNLVLTYFVYFFAWNPIVYIDKDKMWKKMRGKVVEIMWSDIAEIQVSAALMRPALLISFISTSGSIIRIVYGKTLVNSIMKYCTNENAIDRFKQAVMP